MPYTLKIQQIAIRNPVSGAYSGVDVLTEQTTEGLLAELQAKGTTIKGELDTKSANLKSDLDSYVANTSKPSLDTYVTGTLQPQLDSYVINTSKPSLDAYVDNTSKPSLDTYVNGTNKPALDTYVNITLKPLLDAYANSLTTNVTWSNTSGSEWTQVLGDFYVMGRDGIKRQIVFNNDNTVSWQTV